MQHRPAPVAFEVAWGQEAPNNEESTAIFDPEYHDDSDRQLTDEAFSRAAYDRKEWARDPFTHTALINHQNQYDQAPRSRKSKKKTREHHDEAHTLISLATSANKHDIDHPSNHAISAIYQEELPPKSPV